MTFRGYKLHVILITCALIVAVGFGVNKFVYGRHADESVRREFAALPGVERVELREGPEGVDVVLHPAAGADFPSLYKDAQRLVRRGGSRPVPRVVVADDRNDALDGLFARVHLALHEGAATGRFTAMERRVRQLVDEAVEDGAAADSSFTYAMTVDEEAVYFELHGAGGRLYERIPRRGGGFDDGGKGEMLP